MQNKEQNIVYKNIRDLKPYKNNAKKHTKEQVDKIAESIKQFGFRSPVLIDEKNVVIAGHGRILGAKQAGIKTIPTICIDDLTEEQIKAYRLVDNKVSESAWDTELLNMELDDLINIDMEQFGFLEQETEQEETDVHFKAKNKNKVIVECAGIVEADALYDELMYRGYVCKKKTTK